MNNWLTFTIYALAVYRLALLLSDDSGPFRFLSRFRAFLKREEKHSKALRKSNVASGVECVRCNSVWLAAPIATYAYFHSHLPSWLTAMVNVFLLAKALSAIAILLNRFQSDKPSCQPSD